MRRSPVQVRQGAFFIFQKLSLDFLKNYIQVEQSMRYKAYEYDVFNSPKNRKAEIYYKRKCDVGASKNADQAFSAPRLSSHFLL